MVKKKKRNINRKDHMTRRGNYADGWKHVRSSLSFEAWMKKKKNRQR